MRKMLLALPALAMTAGAFAIQPQQLDGLQITGVSRDGKVVASQLYGNVIVLNTETNSRLEFLNDLGTEYELGLGNVISDNYVIVGEVDGVPSYLKDGEWIGLSVQNPEFSNLANAITPDGLRICGSMGLAKVSIEDEPVPMLAPVYWELQSDNTYSEPVLLPYPEHDFTGRVPQYITATCISNDGKTIIGQIVDYSGWMTCLIVYTQDDEGKWSYSTPHMNELLNPNNVTFPEFPGDAPLAPELADFMSDEEKAAYDAALQAWYDEGTWNYDNYPNQEDYISEANKAIYDAAKAEYDEEFAAWSAAFNAFQEQFDNCVENGTPIEFNSLALSADGQTAAATGVKEEDDPLNYSFISYNFPMIFNLKSDGLDIYPKTTAAAPTALAADGSIFAVRREGSNPQQAVVIPAGSQQPVELADYLEPTAPETAAWIRENMYHDIEMMNMETWEWETVENMNFTGVPLCTPNQDLIITHVPNYGWDGAGFDEVYSYLLPDASKAGLRNISALDNSFSVRASKGGVITLEGNVTNLTIVDALGAIVYNAAPTASVIETGLTGAYIIRATSGNTSKVLKAVF